MPTPPSEDPSPEKIAERKARLETEGQNLGLTPMPQDMLPPERPPAKGEHLNEIKTVSAVMRSDLKAIDVSPERVFELAESLANRLGNHTLYSRVACKLLGDMLRLSETRIRADAKIASKAYDLKIAKVNAKARMNQKKSIDLKASGSYEYTQKKTQQGPAPFSVTISKNTE